MFTLPEFVPATYEKRTDYRTAGFVEQFPVPIAIDNGSSSILAGWASETNPAMEFCPDVGRARGNNGKIFQLVGRDLIDYPDQFRLNIRSSFDKVSNTPTHMDTQEYVLDHIFASLGLDGASVPHPIVCTEAPHCLTTCRKHLSELFFESYGVPMILYGIDGLFSMYQNLDLPPTCLVVSMGLHFTHILTVINGSFAPEYTLRLGVGGATFANRTQQVLSMTNPDFKPALTPERSAIIFQEHCYVAQDYAQELKQYYDPTLPAERSGNRFISVPSGKPIATPSNVPEAKQEETEEEKEEKARKKELQRARMMEMQQKAAQDRLLKAKPELERIFGIYMQAVDGEEQYKELIKENGFDIVSNFNRRLRDLMWTVHRDSSKLEPDYEADFSLINVDPATLDSVSARKREGQLLLQRVIIQKKAEDLAKKETFSPERIASLTKHKAEMEAKLRILADKLAKFSTRRSTESSERMRLVAAQIADDDNPDFGMDDGDWSVYSDISRTNISKELDETEEELQVVTDQLVKAGVLQKFQKSIVEEEFAEEVKWGHQNPDGIVMDSVRISVPELLFQPSLVGNPQMGLAEAIASVMSRVPQEHRHGLARSIFLTGGPAKIPGLPQRVAKEIQCVVDENTEVQVFVARDAKYDAWRGAAKIATSSNLTQMSLTRQEWLECGPGYLKETIWSNRYVPVTLIKI